MFEAAAASGHVLPADEDGRDHPLARHGGHHVHQHVSLLPQLVHFQSLVRRAELVQRPLAHLHVSLATQIVTEFQPTLATEQ